MKIGQGDASDMQDQYFVIPEQMVQHICKSLPLTDAGDVTSWQVTRAQFGRLTQALEAIPHLSSSTGRDLLAVARSNVDVALIGRICHLLPDVWLPALVRETSEQTDVDLLMSLRSRLPGADALALLRMSSWGLAEELLEEIAFVELNAPETKMIVLWPDTLNAQTLHSTRVENPYMGMRAILHAHSLGLSGRALSDHETMQVYASLQPVAYRFPPACAGPLPLLTGRGGVVADMLSKLVREKTEATTGVVGAVRFSHQLVRDDPATVRLVEIVSSVTSHLHDAVREADADKSARLFQIGEKFLAGYVEGDDRCMKERALADGRDVGEVSALVDFLSSVLERDVYVQDEQRQALHMVFAYPMLTYSEALIISESLPLQLVDVLVRRYTDVTVGQILSLSQCIASAQYGLFDAAYLSAFFNANPDLGIAYAFQLARLGVQPRTLNHSHIENLNDHIRKEMTQTDSWLKQWFSPSGALLVMDRESTYNQGFTSVPSGSGVPVDGTLGRRGRPQSTFATRALKVAQRDVEKIKSDYGRLVSHVEVTSPSSQVLEALLLCLVRFDDEADLALRGLSSIGRVLNARRDCHVAWVEATKML